MSTVWLICKYGSTPKVGGHLRQHYLGRELVKAGHDVYVISGRRHHLMARPEEATSAPFIDDKHGYKMVRIDTMPYPNAHSKKRILGWAEFAWKVSNLVRKGIPKPDVVVHSSPDLLGYMGAERVARKTKAKLVFEVRDIWPLTVTDMSNISPKHPFIRMLQWVEDRAYRKSDMVISNLSNADDHMVTRGMDRSKFRWLPNGFDLTDVSMQDPLDAQFANQFPKDKFILGYAGTHGEANNLDVMLDAADRLRDRSDIAFVLVGDGKSKADLVARAAELKLDNVHFIDSVPKTQVQSVLAKFSACYIGLPAKPLFRFGVSPNKLFDYFASSKPVVYAIDSGKYNPVTAHKSGIVIAPGNPEALARAAVELADLSKDELQKMGQNGRAAIETDYNYAALGRKMDGFTSELLTPS